MTIFKKKLLIAIGLLLLGVGGCLFYGFLGLAYPERFNPFWRKCVAIQKGMSRDQVLQLMHSYLQEEYVHTESTSTLGLSGRKQQYGLPYCTISFDGDRVTDVNGAVDGF